jgi:hypothetical protein
VTRYLWGVACALGPHGWRGWLVRPRGRPYNPAATAPDSSKCELEYAAARSLEPRRHPVLLIGPCMGAGANPERFADLETSLAAEWP